MTHDCAATPPLFPLPQAPGLFEGWSHATVGGLADATATYGLNDEPRPADQTIVRAGDIRGGRITAEHAADPVRPATATERAILREGDLVLVLVGARVGETALVTPLHDGWIATRSVGILRSTDHRTMRWLRIWLHTPAARAQISRETSAHVEATLSIDALKKLPVAVPPQEQMDTIFRLFDLIAAKIELNVGIAADAVALADAHHRERTRHRAGWTACTFGAVTDAVTGKKAPAKPSTDSDVVTVPRVAAAHVLEAPLPYIVEAGDHGHAEPRSVCDPGTILVAPRPEGAGVAVTLISMAPNRGTLAVRPAESIDQWWLLHELRSRSDELSRAAQGRHGREISRRAFSRLEVAWPEPEVRQRFHQVAEPLHRRALHALDENRTLVELRDSLLLDISRAPRNGASRDTAL
ncbi:type I restriction enzyme S subunit [Nocardiopsis mwathae]|uniref:Type I restriction enzyme S subunit n=1 Tax=Nocardiopsis mwathae TaxID=1472723 RepID=A0A7W9YLF4_9ACTN|nr:hypothetical protein [Nocardiopsis mwathae]MBB6174343.1 type I restriction enzyme S subunit [Nocardiopsis mwathae]